LRLENPFPVLLTSASASASALRPRRARSDSGVERAARERKVDMEWLEKSLREDFDLPPKNPSEEAQRRWRSAVGLVKNRRRRFRFMSDLDGRSENESQRRDVQESIREALLVQKAAFINCNTLTPYCLFGTLLIPYKS